jgi:hypothetical protein
MYPDGNYVFQQDSAPGHTPRTTQQFLRETMAEFWTGLAAIFARPESTGLFSL